MTHDARALALASTGAQRAHALIGLAADHVGMLDADECARYLERAAAQDGDRRSRIRLGWVRCEHALLTGDPKAAVAHARVAARHARRFGSRRHRAKSLLFWGVSRHEVGRRSGSRTLRRAQRMARGRRGMEPILAVVGDVLSRIDATPGG